MRRDTAAGTMNRFFAQTVHLDFPTAADVEAGYLELPATGRALVTCRLADIATVLTSLERAGFFGMHVRMPGAAGGAVFIDAFKGKEGACYDTGKTAIYRGCAAAVLDDDHHVLAGETRICEKTAGLYASPIYAGAVDVSSGDPELLARLEHDPEAFDCDTFEADVKKLVATLAREPGDHGACVCTFYPGPFKLLILQDGTVLRRGEATLVAGKHAQQLGAKDGCVVLEGQHAADAASSDNFIDAYRAEGTIFLLSDTPLESAFCQSKNIDMAVLEGAPESMISRLKKMIERGDGYFILTGSDPRDAFGCCPSGDVGASNRLVEAGLLDCWHPPAPPQSCSSTVYAFSGEIRVDGEKPSFTINSDFRRTVMDRLGQTRKNKKRLPAAVMRWSLLVFAAVSIGFAVLGEIREDAAIGQRLFAREIALSHGEAVVVCFFHREQRCDFCDRMETLTKRALQRYFSRETREGRLYFRDIDMDAAANRGPAQRYGAFTSSIVLVRIKDGKEEQSKLLEDAWYLAGFAGSEEEFLRMMKTEITRFMEGVE